METEQKSNGALIGLIVIVIILIIGGIYLWQTSLKDNTTESTLGTSEDSAQLEADVNSIDLESLDSDL